MRFAFILFFLSIFVQQSFGQTAACDRWDVPLSYSNLNGINRDGQPVLTFSNTAPLSSKLPAFSIGTWRRLHEVSTYLRCWSDACPLDWVKGVDASLVRWKKTAQPPIVPETVGPLVLSHVSPINGTGYIVSFSDADKTFLNPEYVYALELKDDPWRLSWTFVFDATAPPVATTGDGTVSYEGTYNRNTTGVGRYFYSGSSILVSLSVTTFTEWYNSACVLTCPTDPNFASIPTHDTSAVPTVFELDTLSTVAMQVVEVPEDVYIDGFSLFVYPNTTFDLTDERMFMLATVHETTAAYPTQSVEKIGEFRHERDVALDFGSSWRFRYDAANGPQDAWLARASKVYMIEISLVELTTYEQQLEGQLSLGTRLYSAAVGGSLGALYSRGASSAPKRVYAENRHLTMQLETRCIADPPLLESLPVCIPQAGDSTLSHDQIRDGMLQAVDVDDAYVSFTPKTRQRVHSVRVALRFSYAMGKAFRDALVGALYKVAADGGVVKDVELTRFVPTILDANGTLVATLEANDKIFLEANTSYAFRLWTTTDEKIPWVFVEDPELPSYAYGFGAAKDWSSGYALFANDERQLALGIYYVPDVETSTTDTMNACLFSCPLKQDVPDPFELGNTNLQPAAGAQAGQLVVVDEPFPLARLTVHVWTAPYGVNAPFLPDRLGPIQRVEIFAGTWHNGGYIPHGSALATLVEVKPEHGRPFRDIISVLEYRVATDADGYASSFTLAPNQPYVIVFSKEVDVYNHALDFDWLLHDLDLLGSLKHLVIRDQDADSWEPAAGANLVLFSSSTLFMQLYEACSLPVTAKPSPAPTPVPTVVTLAPTPSPTAIDGYADVNGASIELTLDTECVGFSTDRFEQSVASLLNIKVARVHALKVRCGSVLLTLFIADLPHEDGSSRASALVNKFDELVSNGEAEAALGYPVTAGDINEDTSAYVKIPEEMIGNESTFEPADDGVDAATVALAVVAGLAVCIGIVLVTRRIMQSERDARAASPGTAASVDNRTSSETSMHTMGTGSLSAINVDAESTSLDSKYIIDAADLHKGAKIGEGGYGYVYRGEWRGTTVAVKEVRGEERSVVDMLMLEARAAVDLRPHANIVTLYGVCLKPFSIVTAFCEKGSLDDMLYGKKPVEFTEAEEKQLCIGIASGVSHLHLEGMIHRDLAARNILVNANGVPMVADFGMSRRDESGEQSANQTKTTVGPIRWMAPEQMEHQEYSVYSDVWSYGVILYEIFARQLPWKGLSNMKAAQLVMGGKHLAMERYAPPDANACVRKVMEACFEFEAADRPRASWCVQQLSNFYDAPDGGTDWTPDARGKTRSSVRPEPSDDLYAAPPSRAKDKKGGKAKKKKEAANRVEDADATYTAPTKATTPYSSPPGEVQ